MWWTIDRHLTNEQTRQSARATYIDSIKNGVTTVFDHHASFGEIHDSLFAIEDAAKELGIRTCLCYEAVSYTHLHGIRRCPVRSRTPWWKCCSHA